MSERETGYKTATVSFSINPLGTDKSLDRQTIVKLPFYLSITSRRLEKQFMWTYPRIKKLLDSKGV